MTKALATAFFVLTATVGLAGTSLARELTTEENSALEEAVEQFNTRFSESDFSAIADSMPPKILDYIATQSSVTTDQLKAAMVQQMDVAMNAVSVDSFDMDLDGAEEKELPNGEPYVLVPTETVITAGEVTVTTNSHTLAHLDAGTWYLLRIDDASQLDMLREVYPEYAEVEFPQATTTTE